MTYIEKVQLSQEQRSFFKFKWVCNHCNVEQPKDNAGYALDNIRLKDQSMYKMCELCKDDFDLIGETEKDIQKVTRDILKRERNLERSGAKVGDNDYLSRLKEMLGQMKQTASEYKMLHEQMIRIHCED